ncbi:MAG: hypothetical protein GXN92_03270, partial [Candidatus Micrarchaeota archaeon]|nr:hypothetical protein [Candidatus Micrarchaeota archaeon]
KATLPQEKELWGKLLAMWKETDDINYWDGLIRKGLPALNAVTGAKALQEFGIKLDIWQKPQQLGKLAFSIGGIAGKVIGLGLMAVSQTKDEKLIFSVKGEVSRLINKLWVELKEDWVKKKVVPSTYPTEAIPTLAEKVVDEYVTEVVVPSPPPNFGITRENRDTSEDEIEEEKEEKSMAIAERIARNNQLSALRQRYQQTRDLPIAQSSALAFYWGNRPPAELVKKVKEELANSSLSQLLQKYGAQDPTPYKEAYEELQRYYPDQPPSLEEYLAMVVQNLKSKKG